MNTSKYTYIEYELAHIARSLPPFRLFISTCEDTKTTRTLSTAFLKSHFATLEEG